MLKRQADAVDLLTALREFQPGRLDVLASLARGLAGVGALDGALAAAGELRWAARDRPIDTRRMYGYEIELLCRALEQAMPDDPGRLVLLARVLLDTQDHFQEGVATINRLLSQGTDRSDALLAGAVACFKQGQFSETDTMLSHAARLGADDAEYHVLREMNDWARDGSVDTISDAWTTNDLALLAAALCGQDRLADAEAVLRKGMAAVPDRDDLGVALTNVLLAKGEIEAADAACDRTLAINPGEPHALMLRASIRLCRGDLQEGWRLYDNRFRYRRRDTPRRAPSVPEWSGEAEDGRRLMVWREEGIGDEIRFASCLPELAEAGFETVIFECAPRLETLFGNSFPELDVRGEGTDDRADYDLQIPLFSLPGIMRQQLSDFPDRQHYLSADPTRRANWRAQLEVLGPAPRIGICWRSLNNSWTKRPFHTAIDDWGPVLDLPYLTFVNLQVEAREDEITYARQSHGAELHRIPGLDLKDGLDDVAALMAELDAVVSVRCWIPILAGALGVTSYCLSTPFNPFFFNQPVDPWMPTVKVLCREGSDDWSAVMGNVAEGLSTDFGGA